MTPRLAAQVPGETHTPPRRATAGSARACVRGGRCGVRAAAVGVGRLCGAAGAGCGGCAAPARRRPCRGAQDGAAARTADAERRRGRADGAWRRTRRRRRRRCLWWAGGCLCRVCRARDPHVMWPRCPRAWHVPASPAPTALPRRTRAVDRAPRPAHRAPSTVPPPPRPGSVDRSSGTSRSRRRITCSARPRFRDDRSAPAGATRACRAARVEGPPGAAPDVIPGRREFPRPASIAGAHLTTSVTTVPRQQSGMHASAEHLTAAAATRSIWSRLVHVHVRRRAPMHLTWCRPTCAFPNAARAKRFASGLRELGATCCPIARALASRVRAVSRVHWSDMCSALLLRDA